MDDQLFGTEVKHSIPVLKFTNRRTISFACRVYYGDINIYTIGLQRMSQFYFCQAHPYDEGLKVAKLE